MVVTDVNVARIEAVVVVLLASVLLVIDSQPLLLGALMARLAIPAAWGVMTEARSIYVP
jgi:hypothetical protein